MSAGVLWADHYRQSEYYRKYVINRQKQLKGGRKAIASAAPIQSRGAKDNPIRQMFILARRQFDLIRLDYRTLFILLLMLPLLGALFAGVAKGYDFKGEREDGLGPNERLTFAQIETQITDEMELEGAEVGDSKKYIPIEDAQILITMIGLALTQGGTFGAAYEIVKERAIFKRERAVNLSVIAYVLSKIFVLAGFAFIQVVAFLLVLSIRVQLDLEGAIIDWGPLELFITLYLAVVASIAFGLFISAIVPNTDVVLYAILIQLFVQIILGGTLFPLKSGPASWATISYWTAIGIGDTVDIPGLNDKAMVCSAKAEFNEDTFETEEYIECSNEPVELKPGGTEEEPNGDYAHEPDYVITVWIALAGHFLMWTFLTIFVQARKKGVD
jgi:hypothetical protein